MKKIILILLSILLTLMIVLIVVFALNPLDLRTKLIGAVVNSYLSNTGNDKALVVESNNIEQ